MPYTTSELENIDFYQEFIQQLRTKYLASMKALSKIDFRKNDVLYSFEDIFTGLGIEDVDINNNLYKFLYELDYSMYTTLQMLAAKNDPDIVLDPEIRDKRKKQFTVANKKLFQNIKTAKLEKILDRIISELIIISYELSLNDAKDINDIQIKNGDIITYKIQNNLTVWLVEDYKKRKFINKTSFFNSVHSSKIIKILTIDNINRIIDGDIIL